MAFISEADVEVALLDQLEGLGYTRLPDGIAGPDGSAPERASYSEVVLMDRLKRAVDRLNPDIPSEARQDALKKIIADETPSLIEENRRIHRALVEGIDVEFYVEDGTIRGDKVRLIDFGDPSANDWLAVEQFTVIEHGNNRRPDVVVFVNGLPLGVIELKNPGTESATLTGAYNQLQTYKSQIPSLLRTNAALVTADGLMARIGSLTANEERFMPWRTTDGTDVAAKGSPEMSVLVEGVFEQRRFLDLVRDFTVFGDTGSGISKIIAGYHQYHAVRHAVESTVGATSPEGDRKVGVIWHTQGSGKSLLMAFYAGQLVRRPELQNPTIVVMTDRNDLDDQLFGTFSMCRDLIRQTPIQAESREDLQKALNRASGGVIFTTIQKFAPARSGADYPALTDRRNVVVIADEAHRSQYGFKARVEQKTGEIAYGFAKYLRDALPNASFIGFTGTPIELLILVIVCDMWLTGFDAPSMHTMYIDKPMRGHGLMQAIARVNRVFQNKPAGLVVDYIGVAQNLKNALGQYSAADQKNAGIDEADAVAMMLEKYDVVRSMYYGFDYIRRLAGTPQERLIAMAEAIEWILERQHKAAEKETMEEARKKAHRRYQDEVLALSKAFALAAASDDARQIRDEVGFFQTVRAALVKSAQGTGKSVADQHLAVQQIIDRSVVSTEIVDILAAAGLGTPDISILSEEFLAEVQQMEKKNLALEALKKLLNDEITSRSRSNVVETKRFSDRLEQAVARYHTNAISTVEILQELINLAREIREARKRGEDEGLSMDEVAFYDALAENESAVDVMGNDSLKLIAHELLSSLKSNITVDWSHRESVRARMRVLVKRILRHHGYPPDLQDAAVQTVLQQAEALSAQWTTS